MTSSQPESRTAAGPTPVEDAARPAESVPELWTPHSAVILDTSPPAGAGSLFDGDAATGFSAAAGRTRAVRLELGAARQVIAVGLHGTGRANVTVYAEDNGPSRQVSTSRVAATDLASDRWAQVTLASPTRASTLVVQWTAPSSAPAALTELALWVMGQPRDALAEAAVADRLVSELPENALDASGVPWTGVVARVTAHGPVSASFALKLNRDPLLGRAFLVYELDSKAHWTGVARSINGHIVRGGYRTEVKGLGGVQVEEINPAWLKRGDNTVLFQPTLREDGLGYRIRNVRVVSVPRGAEPAPADADIDVRSGAGVRSPLADGDLGTGVGGPGVHTAGLPSLAGREPAFLSFYLDKSTSGTLTLSTANNRARRRGQLRVDLEGRAAGWQTVPIAGVLPPTSELRLRVQGDRESKGQVSEARIQSFPALRSPTDLTVSYPLHGECHDHTTYLRGFVSGMGSGQRPQFFVDGEPRATEIDADGSFESHIQEPAAARGKPWSIRLDVVTAGGVHSTRTVPVDTCLEAPKGRVIGVSPPVEDVGAPYGAVVSPHQASTLSFAGAKLEIPAGAVDSDVRVTMRALDRGQLHPIEGEMDNVSVGGGALRFGPHGLKFRKPVRVTLPVDAARMPPGMTAADLVTFFFDEAASKWTQLPKLRSARDRVVAETTHFTDFIAATMRSPDHPDAQQFNPNTMKNVKVGEPGAGIALIQPPEANSSGSARLSYPIETPPGRNGIGPNLALTYDSERVNTNGWLGVGWDLRLSSIEVDTRFGVPRYDGTELYTLDGAMLTATSPAGTYIRRVEGPFDLIQRTGAGPTTYAWTVTDKRGTVYTYGTSPTSRLANLRSGAPANCGGPGPACVGAIFRWYLEKVADVHGNYMTITYTHDTVTKGAPPDIETYDEVYPSAIDYTAAPSLAAAYHVAFHLDAAGTRPDTTINARPGFLVATGRRLNDITVKSGATLVRQYRFIYHDQNPAQTLTQNLADTLQKSVLDAVALWGTENDGSSEFYRHTFEYYKAPAPTGMFSEQQTWGQFWQEQAPPYVGYPPPRTADGLSHSVDGLGGGSVMVGVGFPNISGGGSFGMDTGGSTTDLAFIGVTGEGLPDQVATSGMMSRNQSPAAQSTYHFEPTTLTGLPFLGQTSRSGWTAGGNISAMGDLAGGASLTYARHVSQDFGIITDMNGDGFPDLVSGGSGGIDAWLNDGKRNFTHQTWNGYSLANSPFSTANRLADASAGSAYFKTDPLIRWVAPFDGTVTVNSRAFKRYADGGDLRAELYIANDPVRSVTLVANNPGNTPDLASSVQKAVNGGDQIYMRVVPLGTPSPNDAVVFSTVIKYDPPAGTTPFDQDPSGVPILEYRYNTFEYANGYGDYRGAGLARLPFHLTADGDISVNRCFYANAMQDDVTVSVVIRDANNNVVLDSNNNLRKWDRVVPAGTSAFTPICIDVLPPSSNPNYSTIANVSADQNVSYEITSDTQVDTQRIALVDNMISYTRYCRVAVDGSKVCGAPQLSGSGYSIGSSDPYPKFPISLNAVARAVEPYYQTYVWSTYNNGASTPQPTRSLHLDPSITSVTFTGEVSASSPLTEDVFILIQGVQKLHKRIRLQKGTAPLLNYSTPPITIQPNEPIFFTIYSPTVIGGGVTWNPAVNNQPVSQNLINRAILDPTFDNNIPGSTTRDPMSGGFHNWFYGDWNDSIIPFDPSRITRTSGPPGNADAVMFGVPGNDIDGGRSWIGRGGSVIGEFELIPGAVSNPVAIAGSADGTNALRVADTWNVELSGHLEEITAALGGGDATTQVDFFDVNGDRFPDSVTHGGVQYNHYNDGVGTFSDREPVDMGFGDLRSTLNASLQAGLSAGGGRQVINETLTDGSTRKVGATVSVGAVTDYAVSSTRVDFADVNGDGLVDHVAQSPSDGRLRVKLNLGYGFSNEVSWGFPAGWNGQDSTSVTVAGIKSEEVGKLLNLIPRSPNSTNVVRLQDTGTFTASVGANLVVLGGGGGPTWSITRKWVDLMDVNGDGLPDQVLKVPGDGLLRVKLNKGDSFADEQQWSLPSWTKSVDSNYEFLGTPDGLSFSTIDGFSKNLHAEFCFFVCIGLSGFDSDSNGGPNADFEDIDGDGKVDQVLKVPGDEYVYTKLNNIGQTNLLAAVNRPLGSRFTISYTRIGNHVDLTTFPMTNMPSNQWVMSWTVLHSGSGQSWDATITQEMDYTNPQAGSPVGYYDPVERESFGYSDVTTRFPYEDLGGTSVVHTYNNQNYYLHGLRQSEMWIQDNLAGIVLRTIYDGYQDPSFKDENQQPPRTGTFFPASSYTYTYFSEGGPSLVTQFESRTFDTKGNLTDVVDFGDLDADSSGDFSDDFNYHIDYQQPATNITVPATITTRAGTTAGSGNLLRKRTATFFSHGKPQTMTDVIVNGKNPDGTARTEAGPANATWTFTYDAYGNVQQATSPGGRTLQYGYDTTTQTYPTSTTQVDTDPNFRYAASASYDLRFGLPTRIVDVAGAKQEIDYDNFGRVTKVFAPSDFDQSGNRINSNAPTIGVTYSEVAHTAGGVETLPAYAMATHRTNAPGEGSLPGDALTTRALRTVNFVDGLTRRIQTKKDIARDYQEDGLGVLTGLSVSGPVIFDGRGRVYQQGQPTFEAGATAPTTFVTIPMNYPTQYAYDVLGRLRQEQHPDGATQATTAISYIVGPAPIEGGRNYIIKTTTDPLYASDPTYHFTLEYLTVRGLKRLHWDRNNINNAVTDLFTLYDYDPLGQLVQVTDANGPTIGAGNTTTADYDTVGNLVAVTSPDSGRREWRYCLGGYVCAEESPNARAAGNLIQYTYERDRLKTISYPSDTGVTFTYGSPTETGSANGYKAGRVKQRLDEAGQFDYAYDALGNVTSETATLRNQMSPGTNYPAFATQYKWDNFGRLIDVTIPGSTAETIRYGYDAGGLVASAHGKMGTTTNPYVAHVGYNEFGERVRITYGNQAYSTYVYAPDTRRLTNANTTIQDVQPARLAQGLVYTYDLVGNATTRTQTLPYDAVSTDVVQVGGNSSLTFAYDPLNQLTHADMTSQVEQPDRYRASYDLTYDALGNITTKVQTDWREFADSSGNWISAFPGNNFYTNTPSYTGTAFNSSPHAPSSVEQSTPYGTSTAELGYDRDGNLTASLVEGSGRFITWTDTDRIRSICEGMSGNCPPISQALYSADGARTHNKVTSSGTTTETLYVNQFLTVRNGTLPTKHVYLGDTRVASKIDVSGGTTKTYWYHSDNIQSTQYVTTTGQAVVQHLEYYPSGEIWRDDMDTAKLQVPLAHATTFSGKELDASGYYYFGARYYDPRAQIWLSPDPILASYVKGAVNRGVFQPKNLGLYTYAWNNPVVLRDPDGGQVMPPSYYDQPGNEGTTAQAMGIAGQSFTRGVWNAIVGAVFGQPLAVPYAEPGTVDMFPGRAIVEKLSVPNDTAGNIAGAVVFGLAVGAAGEALGGGAAGTAAGDLHGEAVAARDALAQDLAQTSHPPATVVGAYSPSQGRVTAGASRGGGLGCAEGVCSAKLGHPPDIKFTPATRPRTGQPVPVCTACESQYGRGAFPDPRTTYQSDVKKR
ncbi:MAG TPA: SpvB/TcaC N-terminal domain-containing protein [Polyangia bacterium]|jgi:RHS repeat-associated protein|nr:SpvB/TcaC N-terminal domain-containing protein [Polyangia bacterium]